VQLRLVGLVCLRFILLFGGLRRLLRWSTFKDDTIVRAARLGADFERARFPPSSDEKDWPHQPDYFN
jgi:hypothetical protein